MSISGSQPEKPNKVRRKKLPVPPTSQRILDSFFTVVTLVGGKRVNKNKLKLLSSLRRCTTSIMPLPPPQEEKNL